MSEQTLQNQIDELREEINGTKQNPPLQDHRHTGTDMNRVQFSDIARKKVWIAHTIYGADSATAANYGVFFIVPMKCYVTGFKEVHRTAGSDGSAVTLELEKLTGTQALGAGVDIISATIDLKGTADTVQTGTLTITLANRNLAIGNRVALKDSGVLTNVANVSVLLELQII